ncbi:MAG: polyprenyl synthetase family protein [Planctomycetes bacterium]|jgi:farnesyl diphosphate synthase|nr:polyprenyl synthetase family protein [Planctomycetota bacterium]
MAVRVTHSSIKDILSPHARKAEQDTRRWLIPDGAPASLAEAMEYCVLAGGKRLRPALVYMCAEAGGAAADDDLVSRAAAAIEFIHCYSLVHDDLPAMDNDVLRRGKPTAHVQYGEAMAILAGDALLTRAFEVLACQSPKSWALVAELAAAAGCAGMIAGQVADMKLCSVPEGAEGLDYIHLRKTAALIRCSARMGAIASGAGEAVVDCLGAYGEALGLAFQLVDDLLDATACAAALGKTPGKDAAAGKRTHVVELGLDKAQSRAAELTRRAVNALSPLGQEAQRLRELALLLEQRTH